MMDQERMDRIVRIQRILERIDGYADALEEIAKEELEDALFYEELIQDRSRSTLQMRDLSVALNGTKTTIRRRCNTLRKEIQKCIDGSEELAKEPIQKAPPKHLLTYSEITKKCPAVNKNDRMSGQEIARRYRTSADKKKQIKILAELNDCTKAEIIATLKEEGEAV